MTRTNATLATIGTLIAAPALMVALVWLLSTEMFWTTVWYAVLAFIAFAACVAAGVGIHALWRYFRLDLYRRNHTNRLLGANATRTPESSETVSPPTG